MLCAALPPCRYRAAVGAKRHERGLAFHDNLDAQTHKTYVDALAQHLKQDAHFGPPNLTPEWQIVDQQVGKMLRSETREELDELLSSMTEEERALMTASERRIMITKAAYVVRVVGLA